MRRRVLALARQRGRVTNADVRALTGCSRIEAVRLLAALRGERLLALQGRGRGAHYAPARRPRGGAARTRRRPRA